MQAVKAARFIEKDCTRDSPCLINGIVLSELVWVLEFAYGYEKALVAEVLETILATSQFEIEDKDAAWAALSDYRNTGADFSDCLVGWINQRLGCEHTVTFDRATRALDGFRLL